MRPWAALGVPRLALPVPEVFVHHSVTPKYHSMDEALTRLDEIARGRLHTGLSYNYVVRGAEWAEGRGLFQGAATLGRNPSSISVVFVGSYHPTEGLPLHHLDDTEVATFHRLMRHLAELGAIREDVVLLPHGERWGGVFNTACPGLHVIERWDDLGRWHEAPTPEEVTTMEGFIPGGVVVVPLWGAGGGTVNLTLDGRRRFVALHRGGDGQVSILGFLDACAFTPGFEPVRYLGMWVTEVPVPAGVDVLGMELVDRELVVAGVGNGDAFTWRYSLQVREGGS